MNITRRGKCRCGKVLTFRYGPDGLKRRCGRCGSIVRLRVAPAEPPADVNATEKKLPVWTYAPTEEMAAVASEMHVDWSSSEGPSMPPPLPGLPAGTQEREVLDAVAADEWVAIEEMIGETRSRGRRRWWIGLALGAALLLLGGIGVWFLAGG